MHKQEVSNLNAKNEYLESKIAHLTRENDKLAEYLRMNNGSFPSLLNALEIANKENNELKSTLNTKASKQEHDSISTNNTVLPKQTQHTESDTSNWAYDSHEFTLHKGESQSFEKIGISIGLKYVLPTYTAEIIYSTPDGQTTRTVAPESFVIFQGEDYKISVTILKIDYLRDIISIKITKAIKASTNKN